MLLGFLNIDAELYVFYDPTEADKLGGKYYFRPRLGNQLINFYRAYAFAKSHDATLVLMPIYADVEEAISKRIKTISYRDFLRIKKFIKIKSINQYRDTDIPYVFELPIRYNSMGLKQIASNLSLKNEIRDILIESCPDFSFVDGEATLNVAVHIRTGDGFDYPRISQQFYSRKDIEEQIINPNSIKKGEYLDMIRPLKAPPLQYYLNAISYFVQNHSEDTTFYVFTDHQDKESLLYSLKERLDPSVDIRVYDNYCEDELIGDLNDILVMSCMDGIIRPERSTFSIAASVLADFSYEIYPISCKWIGDCLLMNKIFVKDFRQTKTLSWRDILNGRE